jgi:thiol-disulfide isomerase/thioredoxin
MQPARRRLLSLALGSAVAGPAWLQAGAARAQAQPQTQTQTQTTGALVLEPEGRLNAAPLFAAALWDLDNRPAKVAAGQPLIVNFWARWCGPCRVEIPELVAHTERKTGVGVIGVNIETDPAPVRDFARAYDVNYPVVLTRERGLELMRALGNTKAGLPFTVVLDRRGAVVASRLGLLRREHIEAATQRALR